ncbi:MAG: endonuclease domain-containing protein, partial [Pseudorhodoplanes sp.]
NRIVIELDGGQHAYGTQGKRDTARAAYFAAQGYRVLRFWNNDVAHNIDGVMRAIVHAVAPPPTPDPSPPLRGGRGKDSAET